MARLTAGSSARTRALGAIRAGRKIAPLPKWPYNALPISTDHFAKEALVKKGKLMLLLAFCLLATAAPLLAHCEIPCGIYGDEARFVAIEEDLTTIEKAMKQITALAGQAMPKARIS